ncbi:MAG: hypothetical protein JWN72_1139 [Thermoleophilia bacterium]|nr:hypothetical protein [Thermoleophilia bacterium]
MTKVETTTGSEIAWEPQVGQGGTPALADTAPLGSFGAEFRELARQRRFVREPQAAPAAGSPVVEAAPAAMPAVPAQAAVTPVAPPVTAATPAPTSTPAPQPSTAAAAADAFARAFTASLPSQRISDDAPAMLAELARMSDRLVLTREELAGTKARAEHAEALLVDANSRLMAARVLVQDAQAATRQSAERSAWLEGRCETLHEALELAVNASVLTRWKWRRQARAAASVEH